MKLVMFRGGVETQEYFSFQLSKTFEKLGYEIYFYNLMDELGSYLKLIQFCKTGNVVMFTFNFAGIAGEEYLYDKDGSNFWDKNNIICINMVVDHPYYYHKYLNKIPRRYYQISVDRNHELYMKRYFPDVRCGGFLPLGGTVLSNEFLDSTDTLIPIRERPMDIIFTGNYEPPQKFLGYISHLEKEYIDFYNSILEELKKDPSKILESVAESMIKRELGTVSDIELKSCYENMIFIDLYVRFYFRGLAIKTLADSGFQIHVFGSGWDALNCTHPENIIDGKGIDSQTCLEKICQAKISLNVMPWFKDGAHDRIFNSMLNGAICLTDDSIYLKEEFEDGRDLQFYDLKNINVIPDMVSNLLTNSELLCYISERGQRKAQNHTWESRAMWLNELIKSLF